MYLPWGYDVSQVTIFIAYIVAAVNGTSVFYAHVFGVSIVTWLKVCSVCIKFDL